MLKINGRRIFNLTGQEIKLDVDADGGSYVAVPSDGIARTYYMAPKSRWAESWTFVQDDGKEYKGYLGGVLAPRDHESLHVDTVDDWFYKWDGDFIVPFEYYFACRELGLPTDRLYTVARPIDDWMVIEGYQELIKH